ncbi:MAG: methyltransferase domain-containing protein [Burkholderiales bacterium]|nr:methyltransferase domain-containing protein [Burkholderiales bacterium]
MAEEDSGARLRSLYDRQGGVTEVFGTKVANYAVSRPDYPPALFEWLRTQCAIGAASTIVDVGAGTGLLTQGLLDLGAAVVAVEPAAAMRAAADALLGRRTGYRSAAGRAEALPLGPASCDLVTAAQAFHWFDIDAARSECLRVLRPLGQVALIWNDRVLADPLHVALDEVFAAFGGARRGALLAHEDRSLAPRFYGRAPPQIREWPHAHRLDEAGLLALVFSRSYMPDADSPAGREAAAAVRAVYAQHADRGPGGALTVRYTTVAFLGRPT